MTAVGCGVLLDGGEDRRERRVGRADLLAAAAVEVAGPRSMSSGSALDVHADQEQQRHDGDRRRPSRRSRGRSSSSTPAMTATAAKYSSHGQDLEVVAADHPEVRADRHGAEDRERRPAARRAGAGGCTRRPCRWPPGPGSARRSAGWRAIPSWSVSTPVKSPIRSSTYAGLSPLSGISIDGSSSWKTMIEPKNAAYGVRHRLPRDRHAGPRRRAMQQLRDLHRRAMTATRITASRRMLYAAAPITPSTTSWPVGAADQRPAGLDPVHPPDERGDHRRVRVLRQQLVGVQQQHRRRADDGDDGRWRRGARPGAGRCRGPAPATRRTPRPRAA